MRRKNITDILSQVGQPTRDRFWSRVNKTETCWLWTAGKGGAGYGHIRIMDLTFSAHRVAYVWLVGEIPRGKFLIHSCENTSCVRPDHMYVSGFPTIAVSHVGEKNIKAKLTAEQVQEIRDRYAQGNKTVKELHKEFPQVQYSQFHNICTNPKTWRNITPRISSPPAENDPSLPAA